jgi:CheY-like chemotaxis protein
MRNLRSRILLVEDELSVRTSMSLVLVELGYMVQLVEDGFSALEEIRREMPNILLTDLNMPGMSGFKLLSLVRQQFPMLRTIAMSGAYCGNDVPSGVTADAFYPKGAGIKALLDSLKILDTAERDLPQVARIAVPLTPQDDCKFSCKGAPLLSSSEYRRASPLTANRSAAHICNRASSLR